MHFDSLWCKNGYNLRVKCNLKKKKEKKENKNIQFNPKISQIYSSAGPVKFHYLNPSPMGSSPPLIFENTCLLV